MFDIEAQVYTVQNSQSCRLLVKYIHDRSVKAKIHHITKTRPLTSEEVKYFLRCSYNGLDELIAKKSTAYQTIKDDIDDMPLSEIIDFIVCHPKILRFPIYIERGVVLAGLHSIGLEVSE